MQYRDWSSAAPLDPAGRPELGCAGYGKRAENQGNGSDTTTIRHAQPGSGGSFASGCCLTLLVRDML
jgi:hypothetical protein